MLHINIRVHPEVCDRLKGFFFFFWFKVNKFHKTQEENIPFAELHNKTKTRCIVLHASAVPQIEILMQFQAQGLPQRNHGANVPLSE